MNTVLPAQKLKAANLNRQLGMEYLNKGDAPRAKKKLLAALAFAPRSAETHGAMAYYFEQTGDLPQANVYYHRALALAHDKGAALNNYAAFLCRKAEYKTADLYFQKAVNDLHYVNSAHAYENAGICATQIPDYTKARMYFIKALQQDGRQKQSLYELVTIELNQHHPEAALRYFQQYPALVLEDTMLLSMAMNAAHKANRPELEATYRKHLSHIGENHEYNNNNTG